MEVAYSIEEVKEKAKSRIFIIDTGDLSLYNNMEDKEQFKEIEIKEFKPKYKNYTYKIVVLEKI